MKTIEERAKCYREENYDKYEEMSEYQLEDAYIKGATEQRKIDIDKACEWIINELIDSAIKDCISIKKFIERKTREFRKAMEG